MIVISTYVYSRVIWGQPQVSVCLAQISSHDEVPSELFIEV